MSNLFVQFINNGQYTRERQHPFYIFQNGLSSVWNKCKDIGDMIWLEIKDEIPDTVHDNIFVSAWFRQDLLRAYRFAKKYPDKKIIVGGEVAKQSILLKPKYILPNLEICPLDAEERIFGEKCISNEWTLEIPEKYKNENIAWTFTVDRGMGCYWGRCTFCRVPLGNFKTIPYIKAPVLNIGKTKSIWFGSLCISPDTAFNIFSKVDNLKDTFYFTYVRPTKGIGDALDKAFKISKAGEQSVFVTGIEFPGNRMLKVMQKGTKVEHQLDMIKKLTDHGSEITINLIINWPFLVEKDLDDAFRFFQKLKELNYMKLSAEVYGFRIKEKSPMFKLFKGEKTLITDPVFEVNNYYVPLDDKQKELNTKLKEIYKDFNWINLNDWSLPFEKLEDKHPKFYMSKLNPDCTSKHSLQEIFKEVGA